MGFTFMLLKWAIERLETAKDSDASEMGRLSLYGMWNRGTAY